MKNLFRKPLYLALHLHLLYDLPLGVHPAFIAPSQNYAFVNHRSVPLHKHLFRTTVKKGIFLSTKNIESNQQQENETNTNIASMRVSQIRAELNELNVDYSDCFDKESLILRLQDVKEGKVQSKQEKFVKSSSTSPSSYNESVKVTDPKGNREQSSKNEISGEARGNKLDDVALMNEIRSMRVRELEEELASRQIRWGGLLEKEDLVRALFQARKSAATFSATGLITPGTIADLTADQLQAELQSDTLSTPLLLDVYATWCGPCKLMADQLKQAALDVAFRDRIRLAKLDSDKYSQMAGSLRVGGLPTIILFDSSGREIDRIEGAMAKKQLIDWVTAKL